MSIFWIPSIVRVKAILCELKKYFKVLNLKNLVVHELIVGGKQTF